MKDCWTQLGCREQENWNIYKKNFIEKAKENSIRLCKWHISVSWKAKNSLKTRNFFCALLKAFHLKNNLEILNEKRTIGICVWSIDTSRLIIELIEAEPSKESKKIWDLVLGEIDW